MTRSIKQNIEVEIAILAGVLGFFLGGLINVKKEIIDILFSAVVSGALVFFAAYYAMVLVFSGTKKNISTDNNSDENDFVYLNIENTANSANNKKKSDKKSTNSVKGKKLDLISKDDTLFDDIYNGK